MRFDLICPYIFAQKGGKKKRQLDGFYIEDGNW